MSICAIINFWDGENILPHAVKQWHKLGVDVIIVYSNSSNYRVIKNNEALLHRPEYKDCILYKCEPRDSLQPVDNERMKRNYGLEKARALGYTHFITADADELYESVDVDLDAAGIVVACQTYFKTPTLTIGKDVTLVPFVHKMTPTIAHAWNRNYPYAWVDGNIRIDPSRQLNINDGVVFSRDILMHHYSYVRIDINSKIENSTARNNIRRSVVLSDMEHAKPGYFCRYYQKTLQEVPNLFGI
jgi:hypothetical protein